MSTLTKFSAIPYTGPAPTNRQPYIPAAVSQMDARAQEITAKIKHPAMKQQSGQDLPTFMVEREKIVDVLRALKDDAELQFALPLDLWGVDYPRRRDRFDVMYQLYSLKNNERVRLKVRVAEGQTVPTSATLFKAYDWFEREVFDMYGVKFEGHPNLRRILTHEMFQGHALRKDYDPAQRWLLTEKGVAEIIPKIDPRFAGEKSDFERVTLNLGPSHPATHGTLRIVVTLDGEKIIGADAEIGYLHRCFEKMSETHTYQQVIPFTDRLNYCSAIINNVGYCMTIEKLLGIEAPPRAQYIRLMLSEFMRLSDHIICIGTNLVDMGALTNFWYLFQPREEILGLVEACCGARLLPTYTRIGGLAIDAPANFLENAQRLVNMLPKFIGDVEKLIMRNRVFLDRVMGVAPISPEDAINYGFTGPCLRACGIPYDVRKASPYLGYETYDFDIPIGEHGDVYDRYRVRLEEMFQSVRILEQALDRLGRLKGAPLNVDDPRVILPPKHRAMSDMEAMIYHFKQVMDGVPAPPGEAYVGIENPKGELGNYLVSDGSAKPVRWRIRPPSFINLACLPKLCEGVLLSDVIAINASVDIVMGEIDR